MYNSLLFGMRLFFVNSLHFFSAQKTLSNIMRIEEYISNSLVSPQQFNYFAGLLLNKNSTIDANGTSDGNSTCSFFKYLETEVGVHVSLVAGTGTIRYICIVLLIQYFFF